MKKFKIIPVIDLLNSKAVHAKKGKRKKYKPLKSVLFKSSNPVEIIKTIKKELGFNEFYIADLDSIMKKTPNFEILNEILKISDIDILLDPGIVDIDDLSQFSKFRIKGLILGLETLKNFKIISQSIQVLNQNNIIISIDMYNGQILSKVKDIKNQNLLDLVKNIELQGIKNIILLDLYRVGQKIGGIPPLYLDVLKNFNGNIFVGGGIKNYSNILEYKACNFSGVLIATALYDGTINIKKLKNLS
jgi:phosphoribosylformimino-5-aminoimidazole carboxamide ribotide isomerase